MAVRRFSLKRHFSTILTSPRQPVVRPPYVPPKNEVPLYRLESGETLGTVELHHDLFGLQPRLDILQSVVVWQLAKKRAGTACTKTRGEVSGGGRKPWRQKGTGRARHGSIRSPLWRGGGISFGPKPKSYYYPLPVKVRRLGVRTALSIKCAQNDLYVVDSLQLCSPQTSYLLEVMDIYKWHSVLFVDGSNIVDTNIALASEVLDKVDTLPQEALNVYSLLLRNTLVLTIGALYRLQERLVPQINNK